MAEFHVPLSGYAVALHLHPDKTQLREKILALHADGMSYREIGQMMNLHFTRVRQIVQELSNKAFDP
jgi:hypothetical protein